MDIDVEEDALEQRSQVLKELGEMKEILRSIQTALAERK